MAEQKTKTTAKKTAAETKPVAAAKAVAKPAAAKVAAPAKAVVAKKVAAVAAEPKVAAAKKVAAKKATKKAAQPSAEERYRMVADAAYFIAERNGFQGCSTEHWAQAELEIAALLDK